MSRDIAKGALPFAFIAVFVLAGGFSLWYWGAPNASHILEKTRDADGALNTQKIPLAELGDASRRALEYAQSVKNGDCDQVVALTWWMQERLQWISLQAESPEKLKRVRHEMCSTLQDRTDQDNRLSVHGVADQYILVPGVRVEAVDVDSGRSDLAKPVANRTWIRVEFPMESQALRDLEGRPLRSLRAGINVSTDGYVLKAGVIGNLDIDWDSFNYAW